MRAAANSSTALVVTPGTMNAETSSSTAAATAQAGRMDSRSRSLLMMIISFRWGRFCGPDPNLERAAGDSNPDLSQLESYPQPPFLQEPVVMSHEQMGFHLAHGVQQHTNQNQHTRAPKERRDLVWDRHFSRQQNWNDGDH